MKSPQTIWSRFRSLWQRRAVKQDIDEELRFHLEQRTAENIAAGMLPEEAARAARKRFGNVQSLREECHDVRGASFGESFLQDLSFAARMLRKNPGFTFVAVLTLALGIGANTAIFTVINKVLLQPLPYPKADRLVSVWQEYPSRGWAPHTAFAFPNFIDLKNQSRSFESLSAFMVEGFNLTGGSGTAERIFGAMISANYFPTLGVQPLLGRGFLPDEEKPNSPHVVMLGHSLWQRRFGSDTSIVGKSITLNGYVCTVIGVLASNIQSPSDIYLPLAMDYSQSGRGSRSLHVIGRLKDGVTLDAAQAELSTIAARLVPVDIVCNSGLGMSVFPLHEQAVGYIRPTLLVLFGAVGFVLLIACTNVAGLLLARAVARQKEMAIRTALGAGRGRIVRQMLTESLLLAFLGGAAGTLLGILGVHLLLALHPPELPRLQETHWDARAFFFSLLITLAAGVVFGLVPALQRSAIDPAMALTEQSKGATGGRRRQTLRGTLVVVEIALALILLVGAGLMIRSIGRLTAVKPGFNPNNVLAMQFEFESSLPEYRTPEKRSAFVRELVHRVATLPGVQSVGAVNALPFSGASDNSGVNLEGRAFSPEKYPHSDWRAITAEYLATLEIPLLRGRAILESDNADTTGVALINHTMAQRYWPDEDPIGKRIRPDAILPTDKWLTIVGVVGDVRHYSQGIDPQPEVYWSYAQKPTDFITLAVRTSVPPLTLAETVKHQIWSLDPTLPVFNVNSLENFIAGSAAQSRFVLLLLGLFAALALLLSAVGIYGVIAFSVSQQTREIGIRMALGAQRSEVLKLIGRKAAALIMGGITAGLIGASLLTQLMTKLLFGISPTDPMTYAGVTLFLALVASIACFIPAWRATKVDPLTALRCE